MKNRSTAILITLFFGGFGMQHFYLNNPTAGVLSVVFCWTFIPALITCIHIIILMWMSDDEFNKKYNK